MRIEFKGKLDIGFINYSHIDIELITNLIFTSLVPKIVVTVSTNLG